MNTENDLDTKRKQEETLLRSMAKAPNVLNM